MKNVKGLDKDKQKPKEEPSAPQSEAKKPTVISEPQRKEQDRKPTVKEEKPTVLPTKPKEEPTKEKEAEIVQNVLESTQQDNKQDNKTNNRSTTKPKVITSLPDTEIHQPEVAIPPINPCLTFAQLFFQNKLNELKINDDIAHGVKNAIDATHQKIKEGLIKDQIKFSDTPVSVEDIIKHKEKKKAEIEDTLRKRKLKDMQSNKENLVEKITKLNENQKILEDEGALNLSRIDPNLSTIQGKELVDENIRKAQLREIKQTKDILKTKLDAISQQVQKLMTEEVDNIGAKKFNIKQFLDNFEKDKQIAEQKVKHYEEDKKRQHLLYEEDLLKGLEKTKLEMQKKEEEQVNQRTKRFEQNRKNEIDLIKKRMLEANHKMEIAKMHAKDKPSAKEEYLFTIMEKKYNNSKEKHLKQELYKIKVEQRKKLSSKEEIEEFGKKYEEEKERIIYEKDRQRQQRYEEIKTFNENLHFTESNTYQKVLDEERKQKENEEYEKLKSKIKAKETKNYSETVMKMYLPKIDEKNKKEVEERIKRLQSKPKVEKHKRQQYGRVLLKKPDPSKPKQYKWKLKLDMSVDGKPKTARSLSTKRANYLLEEENRLKKDLRQSRSKSADKRRPMEKLPDYLTEIRIRKMAEDPLRLNEKQKQEKKWEKMIKNNRHSLLENVEQIKLRTKLLEEQIKMKEKFMHHNGGTEKNPEIGEDVSNMLIDAIKAKLTILDNISKKPQ